jgi:hypothetical protein
VYKTADIPTLTCSSEAWTKKKAAAKDRNSGNEISLVCGGTHIKGSN